MIIRYKNIWTLLSLVALMFGIIQSYLAKPRSLNELLIDSLLPTLVVLTFVIIIQIKKNFLLLVSGLLYLVLMMIILFTDLYPKQYGTFFFLFSIFLLVDWYSYMKFKTNLTAELQKDKSVIALGIFTSTFVFGLITEYVNLPFLIWIYDIPLPSLEVFGIPALIATFGWTPWTLAILSIFYHFILKEKNKSSFHKTWRN